MMHPNEETLLRYRFETLEPTESKQVADHLRTCSECGARFAIIGKSVEKLSAYDTEQDLDPAVVARALEQVQAAREAWPEEGEPAAAEEEAVAPRLGFLQWLGFEQGAPFREVRFAASAMTLAVAVMLGAGEVYVSAREVQTETRVFGEQQLLPGARSLVRIEVIRPKNNSGVEGANVRAVLVAGTKRFSLFEGKTDAKGTVNAWLEVPNEDLGASELEVTTSARGEEDVVRQAIGVRREFKVHLSTDKPLYQPGQTIHVRALAFESNSMAPATGREVMFEVMDPKGNRLSGKLLKASGFGVAAWDVELSSELPLGEYKVSAAIGGQRTEVPVKVSRYTLPKFKLAVKGAQDTFLAGETLRANLNVRYFFGKAVEKAKVHAVLVREDGSVVGEELNAVTDKGGDLKLAIELPSTLAAPGQPEGLTLQLEVTDGAGQQERKSQGFMVARELVALEVLADLGGIVAGLPNTLYVLTTQPDGRPMACDVSLSPSSGPDLQLRTAENGVGAVVLAPLGQAAGFSVEARATCAAGQRAARRVGFDERLADFDAATDRVLYRPGEVVTVAVVTHSAKDAALVRVFKEGRVVHTQPVAEGKAALSLPANLSGSLELEVTDTGSGSKVTRRIVIADPGGLTVKMTTDADTHRPGATARLRFEVKDAEGKPKAVALGLSVVDESLWALTASRPSAARAFFLLDLALRSPRGQLSAGDLLAGKSFSDADQLAARVLLSSAQPSAHAAAFVQNTLHAEERKLQQDRRTWDAFFEVAIKWLLGVLLIAMAFALGRYASSWLAPIALIAGTFAAMRLAGWRWKGEVFWLGCAAYLVAGIAHSLTRRAMAWGYLVLPVAVFPFLILFGDNVRREFAMSADSLAGNDSAMSVRSPSMERKSMKNFGIANDYGDDPTAAATPEPMYRGAHEGAAAPRAAPPRREVRVRQSFPETMYVHPELVTDEAGVATLELPLADSITDWRLSALASSMDGKFGAMDAPIRVFQDFFVDLDTPVALVRGDSATVPIAVHNYLQTAQTIRLEVKAEDWFQVVGLSSFALNLDAGAVGGQDVRIKVLKPGRHTLTVKADGTTLSDAVARILLVSEAGQQKTVSVSGVLKANEPNRMAITIPEGAVAGSTSLMLKVFPSHLASALDGLEGSLKAPHGCFEQTSSTTYPNVLVWNYLKRTGKKNPAVEARAQEYVALGYQRLLSFEVSGGGFEWFGRSPANQVLTAYGLMEFRDMAKVFPVDEKMIQRTQDWLISKQGSNGAWKPDQSSLTDGLWKAGFNGQLMVSAYITWALVESGYQGQSLTAALRFLADGLAEVTDPYTLSMMAATFARANHPSAAQAVKRLVSLVKRDKQLAWFAPSDATLYYSRGVGATIESTALAANALIIARQEPELVKALLEYLAVNRDATGAWHSTQGTVLALRTLLMASGAEQQAHELSVRVNGTDAGKLRLDASADEPALSDLAGSVKPGLNIVEVTGTSDAQFQVIAVYTQPWREKGAQGEEPLAMRVDYGRTKTEIGGIVPVDVQVTYRGTDASGMVVVSVGVPAGLAALTEDLEALVASGAVARFEIGPTAVSLYVDRLTTGAPLKVTLRMKARSKVDTQGVGSLAFLYYHPAIQTVVAATPVQVN